MRDVEDEDEEEVEGALDPDSGWPLAYSCVFTERAKQRVTTRRKPTMMILRTYPRPSLKEQLTRSSLWATRAIAHTLSGAIISASSVTPLKVMSNILLLSATSPHRKARSSSPSR